MVVDTRALRVAHYAPTLGANGGISTYVQRLGDAQSEHGHEVLYYSRHDQLEGKAGGSTQIENDADLYRECEAAEVDILHVHKAVSLLPPDQLPIVRTMHGHQGGCPSGTRFLKRSSSPCDRTYSISGCARGHIVDRCGSARPGKMLSNFNRLRHERWLTSNITTVTVSDFIRRQMVRAGCHEENVISVRSPAPVVTGGYQPLVRNDVPRFLYLGRLVPQKGADWAIRSLARVQERVHLDIAGEGPMIDALRTLAHTEGVAERVTFHGWLDERSVEELLTSARAILFPSIWQEPAGLVTLEAAAHGRPVIASRVGGIPEYARAEFSLLVDPNDVDGLAETIDLLARDAHRAEQMGRAGLQTVRAHFAMRDFVRRMNHVYAGVIRRSVPKVR